MPRLERGDLETLDVPVRDVIVCTHDLQFHRPTPPRYPSRSRPRFGARPTRLPSQYHMHISRPGSLPTLSAWSSRGRVNSGLLYSGKGDPNPRLLFLNDLLDCEPHHHLVHWWDIRHYWSAHRKPHPELGMQDSWLCRTLIWLE